jgi:hypothetical protein
VPRSRRSPSNYCRAVFLSFDRRFLRYYIYIYSSFGLLRIERAQGFIEGGQWIDSRSDEVGLRLRRFRGACLTLSSERPLAAFSIRPSSCAHILRSATLGKIPGFVAASSTCLDESQVIFHCGPHPVFIGSEGVQTEADTFVNPRRDGANARS